MPVMIVEVGSVFIVGENCFDIVEASAIAQQSQRTTEANKLPSIKLSASASSILRARSSASHRTTRSRRTRRGQKKEAPEDLYNIRVIFEKPTTYLAIPLELFKNAMKETSVEVNRGEPCMNQNETYLHETV